MLPTFRAFQQLRQAVVISHNLAKSRLLVQIEQSTQPKLFHTSTILQYRDRQRRGVFADDEDFNREIIDDNNDGFERGRRNFPDREQNFRQRPERDYDDYASFGKRNFQNRQQNFRQHQRNDQQFSNNYSHEMKKQLDPNAEPEDFPRNTFQPNENYENKSKEEIEAFLKENEITIVNKNKIDVPKPVFSFAECGFSENGMLKPLEKAGFDKPMAIQAQGWPIAMSGFDMIGIGETGSGKTLGFLMPAFQHIAAKKLQGEGPRVLILSPTRELAQQTEKVAHRFGRSLGIKTVCCFGGQGNRYRQSNALNAGNVDVVVGTPGRLNDFLESSILILERCTYVVLDEADRMLDMGFEPQIRGIMNYVRPDRQMLMWSATWPKEVEELAQDFFGENKDVVHLNIGSTELQANKNITQEFEVFSNPHFKRDAIIDELKNFHNEKVLVFCQTKVTVDILERDLHRKNINCLAIHGDKSQTQRDFALNQFKATGSDNNILIATDVASRGIDVDDIKLVINYDMPGDIEDYIHRIGRTGRRGKTGKSISYIVESDIKPKFAKSLIQMLDDAGQEVPMSIRKMARNMRADVYSAKKKYRNLQDPYSNQYQNNMDKYQRYGSHNNPRSNYQQNDRYNSYERNNSQRYGNNNRGNFGNVRRQTRNSDFDDDFER